MRESKNFISVSNKVIKMEVISNTNNKQFIWFINYMIHRLAADIPTPQEKCPSWTLSLKSCDLKVVCSS